MKCDKCGYDDNGTGDFAHFCGTLDLKNMTSGQFKMGGCPQCGKQDCIALSCTQSESLLPISEQDLVYRLRKRAEIRRQISSRKSVLEGKNDRIADLLEEAANEIDRLKEFAKFQQDL